jgi:hypothetical protein
LFFFFHGDFQILAPSLRACLSSSNSQLKCFADVSERALSAAVDASVDTLKQQLLQVHREVKESVESKQQLEESLKNGLEKFSIRKMATGSIDDFHKGLADRIGKNSSRVLRFYLLALFVHFTLKKCVQRR